MLRPKSTISAVTSKIILLLVSCLCLLSAAIFGLVGSYRVDVLRADLANANTARDAAEHRRVSQERELETREPAAAATEAPENCAKQGTRGRKHPRNHFVFFGESPCDLHAPPQVSGQGTFGRRYGKWSLHCVGRSGERPRNRSINGAKYSRLNL